MPASAGAARLLHGRRRAVKAGGPAPAYRPGTHPRESRLALRGGSKGPTSMSEGHNLEGILDDLDEAAGEGEVSVGDMVHAFEERSLGALLAVIGLVAALPVIGGIPGVSIVTGTLVLLAVAQAFFSEGGGIWIPSFLSERKVEADKVEKSVEKARPYAKRVDSWLKPRLEFLTGGRAQRVAIAVAAALLAITFYPMAVVPWGVTAPAIGVMALGLALVSRDGYLALVGYAMAAVTVGLMVWLL